MQLAKSTLFFCRLLFPVNVILTSQFWHWERVLANFCRSGEVSFRLKGNPEPGKAKKPHLKYRWWVHIFFVRVESTFSALSPVSFYSSTKERFYQRVGEYFRPLLANSRAKNIASISRSCCHILEMFKCMCHSLLFSGTIPPPRVECKDIAPNEKVGCLVPENTNMTTCLFLGCCWNDTEADSAKKCYTKR